MKTKRSGKTAAKAVAAVVLALAVAAGAGVAGWYAHADNWFGTGEQKETSETGGMIIGESEGGGIKVTSVKIAKADYEGNGISPLSESAYTLTATVEPNYTGEKEYDWSVSFQNSASEWANGKTVTDYVTVTPTADGANTAKVECKGEFGEKIIVTCTSREYSGLSATCTVDYAQKITGMTVTLEGSVNENEILDPGEEFKHPFTYYGETPSLNKYTVKAEATYSEVYTLEETATCKVSLLTSKGDDDDREYFQTSGGSSTGFSGTGIDAVENAVGAELTFDNHMFEKYNAFYFTVSMPSGQQQTDKDMYADMTVEELAERYLLNDHEKVLWRVSASVEGNYGTYTREDSYIIYYWPSAGNYANLSLSEDNLIFGGTN